MCCRTESSVMASSMVVSGASAMYAAEYDERRTPSGRMGLGVDHG